MTKFLITGANGQVGSAIIRQLQGKHKYLALDKAKLDITNKQAVIEIVNQFQPDIIINAAAYTAVDRAEQEKEIAEAINVKGARYLAQAANKNNAIMLHISTDYVFDGSSSIPYKEENITNPQNIYGQTKLNGEIAVLEECPRSIILRTSWVFGEQGNNFVKTILRLSKERDRLSIVNDQIGGPTYAGDIANALIKMSLFITHNYFKDFGLYHFTGYPYVSWFEFANIILEQANIDNILPNLPEIFPITTMDYPTPAKRPSYSCLDLNKIHKVFNISPSDWQEALKNIKHYI
ncbi:dTDP-4-dehydrorhamnose reductase [Volucribacter psittacicida]|uniref:dTDP-4-dehydrorhamnose reductase n=1 Tax=Volucribacter psittacicida TaxID=203482 RepID=A0A4R1FT10_9PAST|nr:dTDP-4-dehydrorhamnose reductase [Volucribacter psittacicida]TCJ97983.1 dTDP-4-dehydrorhamnose reductase [Volucribacter psittacicida]